MPATATVGRLPSHRSLFAKGYALAPLATLPASPYRLPYAQPGNQVVYSSRAAGITVASAVGGALIGALLSADPRIQTYQNRRMLTGGEGASTYRHVDLEGATR